MNKLIIATAALLVATSAQAADSYDRFTAGNPDSDNSRATYAGAMAMQPSVGADLDRYQGIADGNPDLFSVDLGTSPKTDSPDIYGPFGGSNSDLTY